MSRVTRGSRGSLIFLVCVLGVPTGCQLIPGLVAATPMDAFSVGVLLGVGFLLIRPILRLLSLPIGCLTLGLFNFVIDVALVYLAASFVPGFSVHSPLAAILLSVLISAIAGIVSR